jgi:HK97 gp10 family phage protein
MSVPKSVTKFDKNGIKFVSNVDYCQYTIQELTRAALKDVGNFVCRKCNTNAFKLWKGLRHNGKMANRIKGKGSAFQYWVRSKSCDLQVGIKHKTWYGVQQELGTSKQPKRAILRTAVENNIQTIVDIESKYLPWVEDQAQAYRVINEDEQIGGADE